MSKSSRRQKSKPKHAALSQAKKDLQENAPSAIPKTLLAKITQQVTTEYSGPIPPPELLSQYNDVIPDGANRIMVMAEKQIAHRIDLERTVVFGDIKRSWWGLLLGFLQPWLLSELG